jgi:predicted ArsR family transcriptional regulator
MQITRQQIIEYLQVNRYATAVEISQALMLTAANIRHHLRHLKKNGLVEVVGNEPVRGRGRPLNVFGLTEITRTNNLDGLASALLNLITKNQDEPNSYLSLTADQLLGTFKHAPNMHTRLHLAVEKLNQLKYQSSWEASPEGPKILFRNCPYLMILPDHPELCCLDELLLTKMLKLPVVQRAKLKMGPEGSPHCAFITRGTTEGF